MRSRTASPSQTTVPLPPQPEQEQPEKPDPVSHPVVDTLAGTPTLIDFLHTVPAPLVALLVRLAPSVSCLRHAVQILSWQSSWLNSWLVLAAWWVLVLFADRVLRLVCSFGPISP
jgi:hypothetical protein